MDSGGSGSDTALESDGVFFFLLPDSSEVMVQLHDFLKCKAEMQLRLERPCL